MLPSNTARCEACGYVFKPAVDVERLPLFNRVKKYERPLVHCPNCSTPHRIARFSMKEHNVTILPAD